MAIGDQKKGNNQQNNHQELRQGFAGERLTTYTKGILLVQAALSCLLSLWFILSASVQHPFLVMLTDFVHPGVAAMLAFALLGWAVTLLKHVDVLVKEHKA